MTAALQSATFVLALFACFLHPAQTHRGDEEKDAKNKDGLMSLQMLPKGSLNSESRKSSPISSHKFHVSGSASLLEKSTDSVELESQAASQASNESTAPHDSQGGITLKIEYPYERFLPSDSSQPKDPDGSRTIHLTVTPGSAAVAPAAVPPPVQASQAPLQSDRKTAWVGKDFAGLFKSVSYSVIRIQTITAEVNWFEPYSQPQDMAMTGSGLAVHMPDIPGIGTDPIFVTNAHVVRDAHDVKIQLPAIGQQFFQAYVPLICDEFDLAVLQLVNPAEFFEVLKKSEDAINGGGQLVPLEVVDTPLALGMEVASVGFPLGSTSLKLSRGVISGTEEVGDFICYQTTAPISPGSSGGPLFALDESGDLRVVGATFASAASHGAQNTNYVVPAVAITQVVQNFKKQRADFYGQQQQLLKNGGESSLVQQGAHNAASTPSSAEATASNGPGSKDGDDATSTEQAASKETNSQDEGASKAAEPAPATTDTGSKDESEDAASKATSDRGSKDQSEDEGSKAANEPASQANEPPAQAGAQKSSGPPATRRHPGGTASQGSNAPGAPKSGITSVGKVKITDAMRNQQRNQKVKLMPHLIPHKQFQIAPIDAVGIEANQALYDTYGCKNGVFISKILDTSVFKVNSVPPLEERTFLTSIDGVPLDEFGMGRTSQFLHDPTPFESLMMMKVRPGDEVKVVTCSMDKDKKAVEHIVKMEWLEDKYVGGIKNVVEPFWDPESQQYELFAGITVMQLTVNHIIKLLRIGQPPTLGRWLLPENQVKKRLIITHVEKGTYASRVVAPGMVISKVNDKEVDGLDEYRKIFEPAENQPIWKLETDRGVLFATNFQQALDEQFAKAKMGMTFMFCKSVVDVMKKKMEHAGTNATSQPNSLAQTSTMSSEAVMLADSSEGLTKERVTRLARRQALSTIGEGSDLDVQDLRRKMRVAGSGFLTLASSEYVPDPGRRFGSTAP